MYFCRIRKGLNIIIATPGRLVDHFEVCTCMHVWYLLYVQMYVHTYVLTMCAQCVSDVVSMRLPPLQNTASLGVSRVRWLVLDEADRLMEMGFSANIHTIVSLLEEKKVLDRRRRNVLLSATLSKGEGVGRSGL